MIFRFSDMKLLAALLLISLTAAAQQARTISLREAVNLALTQNPDIVLAKLEAEKAAAGVEAAKGAFSPRAYIGSGLGWTDGIPQSVEGATPSVVQATGRMTVYDRQLKQRVKEAEAMTGAAQQSAASQRDEMAYRVAALYLEFEQNARMADLLQQQVDNYRRAEDAVAQRVEEGRVIPLELTRARLDRVRAEQRLTDFASQRRALEAELRIRLGLDAGQRLEPAAGDSDLTLALPVDASAAVSEAVTDSPEVRSLQATVAAKQIAVEAEKGARYPRLDFVAQYSLLAKFNNYDEFFNRFQRHNSQIGLALSVPLWAGSGVSARVAQARVEAQEAEARLAARKSAVEIESVQIFESIGRLQGSQKLARMELDYARQAIDVLMAKLEEGRVALDEVERARAAEAAAWETFYDASYALEKAKLNLLRRTGELVAALR